MNHFEQQSYYELLEIPVSATCAQVLGAYHQAMETYAPDSIAVYTLVDPGQLEALHQRLAQARDVLCALEQRLEYDRRLGVQRTTEELASLQIESLKRAADAPIAPVPDAVAPAAAEPEPAVTAVELSEAEVVDSPGVVEAAPVVAEAAPVVAESALVVVEAVPVVTEIAPVVVVEAVPVVVEAVPVAPVEVVERAVALPSAPPAPEPPAAAKAIVHARPSAPVGRHGGVTPPPLPLRKGFRPPSARFDTNPSRPASRPVHAQQLSEAPVLAQSSAIATAESALAQVAVKARDSRTRLKTVVDISADAEFNGELLRQVREGRGFSPQSLAERTRISVRHVENIEADRYDSLPAAVYLRGMLISMARELGLDPHRVSRSYMALATSQTKKR